MVLVAAVLVTVTAATGCGDEGTADDGADGSSASTASSTGPRPTEAPTTPAPAKLELVAVDHAFESAAALQAPSGALEITLENRGAEDHAATVVRYKPAKSFDDFAEALTRPDAIYDVIETFGGPNAVPPGGIGTATVDLEPGEYQVFCMIPSPGDGIPHLAKGMQVPLTVTASEDPASLPLAEETITLLDYSFGTAEELPAGSTVEVVNGGQVPHELAMYRPAGDESAEEVQELLTSEPTAGGGPVPAVGVGGVSLLDPGRSNTTTLPSEPGEYVLLCFLPTPGSGAPHHTQGMAKVLTLT
jgi:uncharacterized cupredoxin-like copper-binding protein